MKTHMRATSLLAFNDVIENIGERQKEVLECIIKIQPCSNLEISKKLELPINSVVPRVFELRKKGVVVMDKIDICRYTGRKVIYWRVKKWLMEVI